MNQFQTILQLELKNGLTYSDEAIDDILIQIADSPLIFYDEEHGLIDNNIDISVPIGHVVEFAKYNNNNKPGIAIRFEADELISNLISTKGNLLLGVFPYIIGEVDTMKNTVINPRLRGLRIRFKKEK